MLSADNCANVYRIAVKQPKLSAYKIWRACCMNVKRQEPQKDLSLTVTWYPDSLFARTLFGTVRADCPPSSFKNLRLGALRRQSFCGQNCFTFGNLYLIESNIFRSVSVFHCAAKGRRQKGIGNILKGNQIREKGYQKVTENEKKVTKKRPRKNVSGLRPFAYPLLRHVEYW